MFLSRLWNSIVKIAYKLVPSVFKYVQISSTSGQVGYILSTHVVVTLYLIIFAD